MRNYATLDEATLGPRMALSEGDNILTPTSSGEGLTTNARSTIAQREFPSSVEILIYSPDGTNPSLAGTLFMGVLFSAEGQEYGNELTLGGAYPNPFTGYSICYAPAVGALRRNGGVIASLATATYGDYIRMDVDPLACTLSLYKNGTLIGTISDLEPGQSWQYAGAVAGTPGQRAIYFNPGSTPMRYPGPIDGWWEPAPVIESILLSTEGFIGKALNDWPVNYTPPDYDEKYTGDLDASELTLYDSVHFSPWGASAPAELGSGGLAQMGINDPGNRYGALLDDAARGMALPLYRARTNTLVEDSEHLFVGVVDHCEQSTLSTKTLYARDQRSRLMVPIRRALYPPNLIPSVASKPRSMSLGACRNYLPEQLDKDGKVYGAHDGAITGVGQCRIGGKAAAYGSSFNIAADGASFVFSPDAPSAQFTVETTSTGVAFNPDTADYLAGAGDFDSCTYDTTYYMPTDWTSDDATDPIDGDGHRIDNGEPTKRFFIVGSGGAQCLKCINYPNHTSAMTAPGGNIIKARRTYVYKFDITAVPQHGIVMVGGVAEPADLYLCSHEVSSMDIPDPFGSGTNIAHIQLHDVTVAGRPFTGQFTSQYDTDKPLCLVFVSNNVTAPNPLLGHRLQITNFVINELDAIADNVALDGPGLNDMLRGLMIDRGPLEQWEYNYQDADAIDSMTNYIYGMRVASTETPTVEDCVRQVCNSCLVDIYNDDDGTFRVMRLFAPEDNTVLAALGKTVQGTLRSVRGELVKYPDLAENLSSRASGCQNHDPMTFNDVDVSLADVTMEERAKLGATYQWTVTAGIRLAERYRHAYNAEPLLTLLDRITHGQDLVKYINTLYKDGRNFYVGDFYWPFGRSYKLGDVWNVEYDMEGLEDGRQLVIVGRQRQPTEEWCKLIFWGL